MAQLFLDAESLNSSSFSFYLSKIKNEPIVPPNLKCNMNHFQMLFTPELIVICSVSHWACSQRNKSRSESRFGSRSASWLGSWFELRAFTCIANAVPIMNRICALRGNILFLHVLRSLRWLTHAWLQRAFPKCTRTNHVPKELCVHMSSESGFLRRSRSKTPFISRFKSPFQKPDLKELCFHKG